MNFYHKSIKSIIKCVRSKKISNAAAFEKLKDLPYLNLGFARLDIHRSIRRDFPEVIYAHGKALSHLDKIVGKFLKKEFSLILTKADKEIYHHLKVKYPQLNYSGAAKLIYFNKKEPPTKKGVVTIVTAGTSDIPVAEEAVVTLGILGNKTRRIYDVGVAGIHRVLDKRSILGNSRVIIVVAGMEGALASVVGGLVNKPVIAVPTSVGYGASFNGIAPLLTMLNCCAPGVVAVNIDNGFGAAYFANMIR
jgi:NCAIR mutase (PurE)-related protein